MRSAGAVYAMPGRDVVLAVVAALLYAVCYSGIKGGLAFVPPLRFAALRAVGGGALLLAVLAVRGQSLVPARRLWPATAVLAAVGPVAGFAAMFASPSHLGAGLASVLGNTGPLLIIGLAAAFLGETVTSAKLGALACGIAGVTLIAWPRGASNWGTHPVAIVLPLLAAISGATESIIVKRVSVGADAISVAAWQFLLASLPLFALSTSLEASASIRWVTPFVLNVTLLAAGATAGATAIWYSLIRDGDVGRLSLMLFLVPVLGLALGVTLFDERVTAIQAIGVAVVLAGTAVARFARAQPDTLLSHSRSEVRNV